MSITIECNMQVIDFLDVNLDLKTDKYYPFRKPNSEPLYINSRSNHPPSIIKQIPSMISQRISENSCSLEEFNKAAPIYNKALAHSGFKETLKYTDNTNRKKRSRKRNVIWFNPPYGENVKTNIGKIFLNLVCKHFPKHHQYHNLFNRNNVKLSYSCMPNMEATIRKNNFKLLNKNDSPPLNEKSCNCLDKDKCPLEGQCLTSCFVYNESVKTSSGEMNYVGTCEGPFKQRYNNHTKSFRNRKYEKDTELSKHIWKLKDSCSEYSIKWSIAARAAPYASGSKKCDLFLTEKLLIATSDPKLMLNKREEIISKCRHINKFTLKYFKT